MKTNSRQQLLLQKYLEDQCTHAELEELFHYLSSDSDASYREVMDELWEKITEEKVIEASKADHLLAKVIQAEKELTLKSSRSLSQRSIRWWYRAAAVFTGVVTISVMYLLLSNYHHITEYTTDYGETKVIVLPDGSTVMLNSNSSLAYDTDWQTREVQLEGEAFFEVKKNTGTKQAKFIVYSENLAVEVLGTQFNVNTRRDRTRVVLQTGKVKLSSLSTDKKEVTMVPGEMAEYAEDQEIAKKLVDVTLYTSWRKHEFIFRESSLREIAMLLQENYGFEVVLKDEMLAEKKFTGTFPTDKLNVLLRAIEEVHNLHIHKDGHVISIEKGKPGQNKEAEIFN